MVFVESLSSFDASEDGDRQQILNDATKGLQYHKDDCEETKNAVRGHEMRVVALVDLDDGERAEECQDAEELEAVMNARPQLFL